METKRKNRTWMTLSAVGIHICIGSVYAWSVFTKPIQEALGCTLQDVQWTFSLAIFFLGTSAAFLGSLVEKIGPSKTGLVSAAFFATGLFGSAAAIAMQNLWMLYIFYGFIGGIGLGTGYVCPVSTLIKWFPRHRGFATGCAIMGFGFAGLLAAPLIEILISSFGLIYTFVILGVGYLCIMIPSALYLAPPAEQDVHPSKLKIAGVQHKERHFTTGQALKTWQFYALWWMLFINITCGIAILSVASPIAQDRVHMSATAAATMVGIVGLVNGVGRLFWSSVSDRIGRANIYMIFFVIEIIAFYLLTYTTDVVLFQVLLFIIISCYGGGFSTMPALLSDMYGTKSLGSIHGKILTAWAAAGIVGPVFVAYIKESTQSYEGVLPVFAVCFAVSLIPALIVRMNPKAVRKHS